MLTNLLFKHSLTITRQLGVDIEHMLEKKKSNFSLTNV